MYVWEGGPALVQTVDFFTPIVDDPYIYGQIAAANALSDVYAMGGEPRTALAIAAFPQDGLDRETIVSIFRGGNDMLREAGAALLGGHTVRDPEIKFGYAVTGAVARDRILTNTGARPGDVLILTKPIGTGVVGTAIKFDRAPDETMAHAIASMRTLNKAAAAVIRAAEGVHACTDVTGFGLIGHSTEIAAGSRVTVEIEAGLVPLLEGVLALVEANGSGGMASNRSHFSPTTAIAPDVPPELESLLFDPQTSGGLLIAVEESFAQATLAALEHASVPAKVIGRILDAGSSRVTIR